MGWNQIRGYSEETLELRKVSTYVFGQLTKKYNKHHGANLFQMDFHRFMKSLRDKYEIPPSEVLLAMINNNSYIEYVYHRKFKELRELMIQSSKTPNSRELVFTMLYYDSFFSGLSFFGAIKRIKKYPYAKFTNDFIRAIFTKHPYLKTIAHIDYVKGLLNTQQYAQRLLAGGIKEFYL